MIMKDKKIVFLTGSQNLYGAETLKQVDINSNKVVEFINNDKNNPINIVFGGVVKSSDEIEKAIDDINYNRDIIGVIVWMHTFSPAKMWIRGLKKLNKPLLHLHTQFNEEIPLCDIDMDYMNLHQSAHGDREFGHLCTKLNITRKVVTGYYKNVSDEIFSWARACGGYDISHKLNVARFGDNMRNVAVTDGDKVGAHITLGWSVDAYGLGDLVEEIAKVDRKKVDGLLDKYKSKYNIKTDDMESIKTQAQYEIGIENFLKSKGCLAFTTNFENLHGLDQLPGLAVQRLMEKGYGFGAEGDWKTAALLAILKYMAQGKGGTSFMEDYTYNLKKDNEYVLGAHMLEICPTLSVNEKNIVVEKLDIGGKKAPARMTFKADTGNALAISLIDLGGRLRLIVNEVEIIEGQDMPSLPVAQVIWKPLPSLKVSATCWLYAGGAHHTVLTTGLSIDEIKDYACIAGIELVVIDKNTEIDSFKKKLINN